MPFFYLRNEIKDVWIVIGLPSMTASAVALWFKASIICCNAHWHSSWLCNEQEVFLCRFSCSMPHRVLKFHQNWSVFCPHLFLSGFIRREQGVSGQSSSIMVEGVQVALPSYEEAVYGSSGPCSGPSPPPPAAPPESRVPIVLSEGLPQGVAGGQSSSRSRHHRDFDFCLPSTSSSLSRCHAETVLVHQVPSSSSSSSWAREHPGGACAGPLPLRRDSESSDEHSLLSVTSTDEISDGEKNPQIYLVTQRLVTLFLFEWLNRT